MMKNILTIFFILFFSIKLNAQIKSEINIIAKINDEIITNFDVEKEINYLIAINNQLQNVELNELKKFAKESLIKEIIKKRELLKYYALNQENDYLDNYIKNFYEKLQINSKQEFELYLSKYDLSFLDIKNKLEIEVVWNEYIYTKYKDQVNIDIEKIKKKIDNTKIIGNSYLLSEILYLIKSKKESELKYQEIVNSINEIGFINTASVYSVSDTSKYGGDIGWVNERQLTKNINEGIKELNIGEVSKAIVVPGGVLILKVNNKKKEDLNIDKDDALKKQIAFEKNKQFNQFSLIYYNKIKFNAKVDEK
jgi:peptidyl-prolyl cis-trans isomerase SurA